MTAELGRIERLVSLGELTENRARKLAAALEYEEARRALPPADPWTRLLHFLDFRTPTPADIADSLYLSGRIDRGGYLRRLRNLSVAAAAGFFVALLITCTVAEWLDRGRLLPPARGASLVALCALGAAALGAAGCATARLWIRRLDRLRRRVET